MELPVYTTLQQTMAADAGEWRKALQLAQAELLQQLDAGRALLLVCQRYGGGWSTNTVLRAGSRAQCMIARHMSLAMKQCIPPR